MANENKSQKQNARQVLRILILEEGMNSINNKS